MKTLQQVKDEYLPTSEVFDGRDVHRLVQFVAEADLESFGIQIKEEYKGKHQPIEWTEENILKQLKDDVEFGFEKALGHRGISAGLMHGVVSMWNWILENGINEEHGKSYAQYGLPLFKATAIKYGFDNPIGEDSGSEDKYSEHG